MNVLMRTIKPFSCLKVNGIARNCNATLFTSVRLANKVGDDDSRVIELENMPMGNDQRQGEGPSLGPIASRSSRPDLPMITSRNIEFPNPYVEPKQAWLENMSSVNSVKLGIVDLHPDIFSAPPRIDILYENVEWQRLYKYIDWEFKPSRAEMKGGGRKPWPAKGSGRHRAGSIRAPQWHGGGSAIGPRGPRSFFHMIPQSKREMGLRIALSVKYAQNDLHIVDSLEIPSSDPSYLQELLDTRYWGFSALFVDDTDIMPVNMALAASEIGEYNLLPVYGLNVKSILKHETLVLTLAALDKIEQKLLEQMHSPCQNVKYKIR